MKDILITVLISTIITAIILYGVIAFVVLEINAFEWHYSCRIIYVFLLTLAIYGTINRLTNGNKGSIQ